MSMCCLSTMPDDSLVSGLNFHTMKLLNVNASSAGEHWTFGLLYNFWTVINVEKQLYFGLGKGQALDLNNYVQWCN